MIALTLDLKMLSLINKHAASSEETRYYLNGVFLEVRDNRLFMVATDGHKLIAHCEDGVFVEEFSCIVPRKFLDGIKLDKVATKAEFKFDAGKISIEYKGNTYATQAVDGAFPDWRRVVPRTYDVVPSYFKGDIVKSMDDFAKALHGTRDSYALIAPAGRNNPALVSFGRSDVFGVVMPPVKMPEFTTQAPSWSRIE